MVLAIASPGLALLLLIATVGSRQQPGVAAVALVTASIVVAIILVMAMGAVSVLWIPDGKGGAGESRTWSATTGTRRPVMGRRRRTVALVVALVVVVVVVLTGLLLGGVGAAEPSWQVGLMFGSVLLFAVAFVLYRLARRAALLTAANLMRHDRRPICCTCAPSVTTTCGSAAMPRDVIR